MEPDTPGNAPTHGDEATMLRGFLDHHRQALRWKTAGLSAAQLATPLACGATTGYLSLGGMLKHSAHVEDYWMSYVLRGAARRAPFDAAPWDDDPEWEWRSASADTPAALRAMYDEAVAASDRLTDEMLAGPDGLDTMAAHGRPVCSLRWVLLHLLEEYARENGYAAVLREAIDAEAELGASAAADREFAPVA
ncbi:mycothiol transferase [Puerhibacterium puerhi]|uniref:mycothiol transferase n=1 Tax=Puerhibacterium puerhi TaxID=2692623 RepID=UPI00135C5081|nr:DUF664 domain-containing protein [Puerhibacterium puerhi]